MKKPVAKKATRKTKPTRNPYVVVSFTVPPELEDPMNAAAALRGLNRSQYICWLVERDVRAHPGELPEYDRPRVPSRIKRK